MFPRRKRLSREAFPSVLKGRRISSTHFSAVYARDAAGYAVVVPKKVARLSVMRHRAKRRTLEALRTLPTLPSALIIFPKQSVALLSHKETCAELATLLSKIA